MDYSRIEKRKNIQVKKNIINIGSHIKGSPVSLAHYYFSGAQSSSSWVLGAGEAKIVDLHGLNQMPSETAPFYRHCGIITNPTES